MMTDDEIRSMLHAKAAEVTGSDDAWDKIAMRLAEPQPTKVGRRAAVVGVAAAAIAGTVFVANVGPTSQVANPAIEISTTTTVAPAPAAPVAAATQWLEQRLPGTQLPEGQLQGSEDGNATVLFRSAAVDTEVFVRQLSGREGWVVVAAASDLVPIFDPVFEDGMFSAEATAEAAGTAEVFYESDETTVPEADEPTQVEPQQGIPLRRSLPGTSATAWVILRPAEGPIGISQVTAAAVDPAAPSGEFVSLWPAVDAEGLRQLQRDADGGDRPDLLDPRDVAGRFLGELLPGSETAQGFGLGEFRLGDATSGEVPYALPDGADGTVLLRRSGGEGSIWYVVGAASASLEVRETRREETHLVADVRSSMSGTLTWTGATSIEVRGGETASIGRPDTPTGRFPVVVRLLDGDRTVALVATLAG